MAQIPLDIVLFDLDGTLLDTAADISMALNRVLVNRGLEPLPYEMLRSRVYGGSRTLLKDALQLEEGQPEFEQMKKEFHQHYRNNLVEKTVLFEGMEEVLRHLESHTIPWGIVTNKPVWLAEPLLKAFALHQRMACLIGGDTLSVTKPHPEPLLHACKLTRTLPEHSWYIGDSEVDMQAAKAARMRSFVAAYGYIPEDTDPKAWGADEILYSPRDLLHYLKQPKAE
ncbi:MAG TPA: phosphoglycolate phosphatase [Coxiellaceae bacterium]|nr:phosphoglycolate phosphatase [Coxiellaceae bacterium]